ncbi:MULTISPECIES: methionine ABC transporter ATP-binding protein [unclassified Frigoribacterium]|uniref:methionine ABC transporter ATP-binding protein n=1 Tax=unclassified Frigoribacterium TaxID=2627005 RepID=UPI0006F31BD6|nr:MULTISPECIES: methionine ABC transporter ATP-binding protein [unclassified Frigoribacterium]KQO82679.1 methionine ABC transporter ATP-binding protein [Frigoribacterium sp. Leaf263]KQR64639.1 methionine ABC transporter ATP-binding protein [Frigoribacterium sp. Leaf172]
MPAITLTDVVKTYPPREKGAAPLTAVDGVSLEIADGEIFGIIGYSGAGKSTLVRLINALEPTTSGRIEIDGSPITGLSERQLRVKRAGIGMIFQQFNLFSSKTVWGNVEFPLKAAGVPRSEHQRRISDLLHFVGLADKAHARPDQLSGGQKQRVGIARALATSPGILLADEATSALDPETTQEVLALLRRVNAELGITIVVITHEMDVIKSIADRVAVMDKGRVVEIGETFDVFSAPRETSTRRFVSTVVAGSPDGDELTALRGRHAGRLVTVRVSEGGVDQGHVFGALARHAVGFEIVYGGIDEIAGRTFGTLTLALSGRPTDIDAALADLGAAATELPSSASEGR